MTQKPSSSECQRPPSCKTIRKHYLLSNLFRASPLDHFNSTNQQDCLTTNFSRSHSVFDNLSRCRLTKHVYLEFLLFDHLNCFALSDECIWGLRRKVLAIYLHKNDCSATEFDWRNDFQRVKSQQHMKKGDKL